MKQTAVNFLILLTCLTICYLLFSLNYQPEYVAPPLFQPVSSKHFKLFNLNFRYLLDSPKCDNSTKIIMIITSYYGNIKERKGIRKAFAEAFAETLNIRRVFLLAEPRGANFEINNTVILEEHREFADLIQGNFVEAYRNLTYKHLMGLHWASTRCSEVEYVIKMDDDIVVRLHKLSDLLQGIKLAGNTQIAGYILSGMEPIREPENKWFVTHQEYSRNIYPPFVSGWFYVTTPKVAKKLVELSKEIPYFWIDDVYVTGILAEKLHIEHYNLNKVFAVHYEYIECCLNDVVKHKYDCDFLVGPNGGHAYLFQIFNHIKYSCRRQKCKPRPKGVYVNNTCVVERKTELGKGRALIQPVSLF